MSLFSQGLRIGFNSSLLNGFCGWNFCMPNFCMNPFMFNPISLYMVPSINSGMFSSPEPYNYPQMFMPDLSVFAQNMPQMNFNFSYMSPQCQFGDFYTSTKKTKNNIASTDATIETESTVLKTQNNKNSNISNKKDNLKSKYWYEMSDSEMLNVYGNYTRDITKPYTGTVNTLNEYLKGKGVLEDKGQAFMDAQNKYGISATALVAICMNESASGSSQLAKKQNNVGGVRITGKKEFRTFKNVEECIDYMGSFLKSGYVNKNLTKLYQVNAKYCPASDSTDTTGRNSYWASAVNKYMGDIEKV